MVQESTKITMPKCHQTQDGGVCRLYLQNDQTIRWRHVQTCDRMIMRLRIATQYRIE